MYALYMQDHGACWYAAYGIKMLSLPSEYWQNNSGY